MSIMETTNMKKLRYPISTDDGYAVSIKLSDVGQIVEHLDQYGLVFIEAVLSPTEKAQTLEAFFQESNEQQRPTATRKLSLDPLSWDDDNWPNKSHFLVQRRPTIGF
mmetsp:Transcript_2813/g.6151  ORF Transcript_2813/g.6151 Transcript_2813/m.6151 type:complete len:107 (+) Transcript_2813:97-417(+)